MNVQMLPGDVPECKINRDILSARQPCGLTILRTTGAHRAAKSFRWNPTLRQWLRVSYQAGSWFTAEPRAIAGLRDLAALIERLQADPRAFVVRGALAPDVATAVVADPGHRIRRRKHAKGGVAPSLIEVPRQWFVADIDGWPLRASDDLADDPGSAVDAAIRELLPETFHDAECWWQLSASAGFAAGMLKVHAYFWLSAPATNEHIKAVLRQHAPGVDTAPYSAAQPIFTAAPIIDGGHDPLPRRTGWREGTETEVVLPALRPEAPRQASTGAGMRGGDVGDALAALGHGEGGQGFHAPLRTAIMRYARGCSRQGGRDDVALKVQLRAAIRSAPCRPGGDVETPYCTDYYLDSLIAGAFALLAGQAEIQVMHPHHARPEGTADAARATITQEARAFLGRALEWNRASRDLEPSGDLPEHAAIVATTGLGKSTIVRGLLAEYLAAAKGGGSTLPVLSHRVLWLVPTHKLGNEALADLAKLGIRGAVMRGREAEEPSTKETMCQNLPAVHDALAAHADVERTACGSGLPGEPSCPFRATCAFQRQKPAVATADVVVAAHQALFHQTAKEAGAAIGLVIVDEAWWQTGLAPNQRTRLSGFAEEPTVHPVMRQQANAKGRARQVADDDGTADLHVLSGKLQAVFSSMADGKFLSREAAATGGLTDAGCTAAIALEWARMRTPDMWPGQPPEARKGALQAVAGNAGIGRRVAVWTALRDLLTGTETHTGRLTVETVQDDAGPYRAIINHGRRDIRDRIASVPLLLLDATMPVEIVRRFLPRLAVLADVKAATPHVRVHQVVGGWGKTSLSPSDKATPAENTRRAGLVAELADFAALHGQGNGAVVTYAGVEPAFARPGMQTGHFNAVAGLDGMRDVRALVVVGRPLPRAEDTHRQALALTGRPIAPEASRVESRGVLRADGTGAALDCRTYADADMEAVRAAIVDAEVVQAAGRARAVNRTAATPLDLFVLSDVVMPFPVDRLARWEDVRPNAMERMASRGAVFSSPRDAAAAYPDLFSNPVAAQHALSRDQADFRGRSLREAILGAVHGNTPSRTVTYRPAGRGQQTRTAEVTPDRLPGFRAELETLVGTLTVYVVTPAPTPLPAPAPAPITWPTVPAHVVARSGPLPDAEDWIPLPGEPAVWMHRSVFRAHIAPA